MKSVNGFMPYFFVFCVLARLASALIGDFGTHFLFRVYARLASALIGNVICSAYGYFARCCLLPELLYLDPP